VKRAEALLFYCLDARRPLTRLHLCDLFWPGKGKEARDLLSDTIWRLRNDLRAVGATRGFQDCLICTRETVAFDFHCAYSYDVEAFEHFACAVTDETPLSELERAVDLYRGKFLETFHVSSADADFDDWVSTRQHVLESHYHTLLQLLSTRHMARGDCSAAILYLDRLLVDNPEEQVVYGLLMVCYAVTGQSTLVQKTYQQYVQMGEDTFGMAPDAVMVRLYHTVQRGQLSTLQTQDLITSVIQANQQTMDPQLRSTFLAVLKGVAVKKAPVQSVAYRRVLRRAQEQAAQHGCTLVGTPHLFLALCADHGTSMRSIQANGLVSLDEVMQTIRFVLGENMAGSQAPTQYTLELQHILQVARDLAEQAGAEAVNVPHLWSALLQGKPEWLEKVLEHHDVSTSEILTAIG
jgi:DNA-binding SARP family transcriptional activator